MEYCSWTGWSSYTGTDISVIVFCFLEDVMSSSFLNVFLFLFVDDIVQASIQPGGTVSFEHRNIKGLNRSLLGSVNTSNLFNPQVLLFFYLMT